MAEIRCENGIKFADVEDGVLEVKCRSKRCGHEAGAVVIHRFLINTGELLETRKFKTPSTSTRKGAGRDESSLRSA